MALYDQIRWRGAVGQGWRRQRDDFGRCVGQLSGSSIMALDAQAGIAATTAVPGVPRDQEGPTFREPWEAQAFAMAVALYARGVFTWKEWTAALAAQIKQAQAAGDADTGETYYRHWLATLEHLVAEKGVASAATLHHYRDAWDHAAGRTAHGAPIELKPWDFPESLHNASQRGLP